MWKKNESASKKRRNKMTNEETRLDFIEKHAPRALCHYVHAKEKHPYFCDAITYHTAHTGVPMMLRKAREQLKFEINNKSVTPQDLIECELWEAKEAFVNGDTAHAVEECYDCIAVLLRTIDVLEGRQKLGKPETKGETK